MGSEMCIRDSYVAIADMYEEDFDDDSLTQEIAHFFPQTYADSFAGMRFRILEFCRAECIGPRQFFHHLGNVATDLGLDEELLGAFRDDYPLYRAIKSVHLFQRASSGESAGSIFYDQGAWD